MLDADGVPIARARVILRPRVTSGHSGAIETSAGSLFRITYTDHGGRFRFDGVMDRIHDFAVIAGSEGVHFQTIAAGRKPETLRLQLDPGLTVHGQVEDQTGAPVAHAEIQYLFSLSSRDGAEFPFDARQILRLATDADGSFRIRGLPEHGRFTSWAMHVVDGRGYRSAVTGRFEPGGQMTHVLRPWDGQR